MDYNNVKGPLPRFWKVSNPTNNNLGLLDGDLLVFDGDLPGTVTMLRPKAPGAQRNAGIEWGKACSPVHPKSGFNYAITGRHVNSDHTFRIDFKEASGSIGASHQGEIPTPPDSGNQIMTTGGTWMADEGL